MAEERAIKSINQHEAWADGDGRSLNFLVQPATGEGSGVGGAAQEQYKKDLMAFMAGFITFSNVINNLTATAPGGVLDARQGKILKDAIDTMTAGLVWKATVKGFTATPPEDPTDGEAWIVDTPSGGAFVDRDGQIAVWSAASSAWAFSAPRDNWAAFDETTFAVYVRYGGQWSAVASFAPILDVLTETEAARDTVLGDEGFIAVAADLTGDNDIGTVADAIEDVMQAAAIHGDITAVSDIKADVSAVAAIGTDVPKVAAIDEDVSALATIDDAIAALAAIKVKIEALYDEIDNIGSKATVASVNAHLGAEMPHIIEDLSTGKSYRYGYRISAEGLPQTIYEEVTG